MHYLQFGPVVKDNMINTNTQWWNVTKYIKYTFEVLVL